MGPTVYLKQMAIWLQQQEAMWKQEAYLVWIEERFSITQPVGEGEVDDFKTDSNCDSDSDGECIAGTTAATVDLNNSTTTPSASPYTVTKKAPFHQITIEYIISDFGTTNFLGALCTFLRKHLPACKISPHVFDCFDVYKQINIHLPYNQYLSNHSWADHICTTPAIAKLGRRVGTAAQFDTALLVENWEDHHKLGGLEGLHVAQIQVIFKLPSHFGFFLHLLAYVEWFTPLVQPDNLTGMHIISWSMHLHCQNAAVVSAGDIVYGCHLMGKSSLKIDPSWTMDNVLDLTTHFYLNPYIIVDSFTSYNF